MVLHDTMAKQGDWLFRWRSYFPLVILPVLLAALAHGETLERAGSGTMDGLWEGLCAAVALLGIATRWFVAGTVPRGTSGRNTTTQRADELNTTGLYSAVRHPLYLANFLIMLSLALFTQVWWFVIISILAFWVYYERIICAEEAFLQREFGEAFLCWVQRTPAFIPSFKKWTPPPLPFSLRTVLKKECTGLLWIGPAFALTDFLADGLGEHQWHLDPVWGYAAALSLLAFVVLVAVKKTTTLLAVKGR